MALEEICREVQEMSKPELLAYHYVIIDEIQTIRKLNSRGRMVNFWMK